MPRNAPVQFVGFNFLDDFEEVDGKPVLHPGTNKCVVRLRSAKGVLPPGTCHWGEPYAGQGEAGNRCLAFVCPCGCGEHDFVIAVIPENHQGAIQESRGWRWDGNFDSPTLIPSINCTGCWHGWLQGGIFRSC